MGSNAAALIAGQRPKNNPTTTLSHLYFHLEKIRKIKKKKIKKN